jgi:hypothetical protein
MKEPPKKSEAQSRVVTRGMSRRRYPRGGGWEVRFRAMKAGDGGGIGEERRPVG